ncbi:hypothetical protein AOLI_G00016460 [Acnodon oligacanthus]
MLLCFFLGTPAHSWLLWLLFHHGWKIKPSQVFLVNRTVLELIFCIQCAVAMLDTLTNDTRELSGVSSFTSGLSWIGRPLMQICICVERYLAVIHPIIFLKYKGIQYRTASAAVVWLVAAAYGAYEAFTGIYCEFVYDIVFVIAVIVISFCCASVLCALKHPGPGDAQITTQRALPSRVRSVWLHVSSVTRASGALDQQVGVAECVDAELRIPQRCLLPVSLNIVKRL